jgi:hypothetical protein
MFNKFLISNRENIAKVRDKNNLDYSQKFGDLKVLSNSKFSTWCNKDVKYALIGNYYGKSDKKDFQNFELSKNIEGSFVLFAFYPKINLIEIWTDKFSTKEVFYSQTHKLFTIASDLDFFDLEKKDYKIDSLSVAQSLVIYGARPSKKNTFYKNIKRLGIYEKIIFKNNLIQIEKNTPNFLEIENYTQKKHDEYFNIFIETIKMYSSTDDNVVYLSSGWDSTSILAGLNYIYGKKKIRPIICKLNYSKTHGITNKFELEKAKKICDFYDLKLEIVENNYVEKKFVNEYLEKLQAPFRSLNFNVLAGLNHYLLAEHASKFRVSNDTVVFSGEMSDGAHNLGFSQYFTIFHPESHSFREYSDKMMTYLFSPTFLKQIINGKYINDPVWKILNNHLGNPPLQNFNDKQDKDIKKIFLRSFFVQSSRFPMVSLEKETFLSNEGKKEYESYMFSNYIDQYAENLNFKNFYSIFLHLYNSFHWQGSTVATIRFTAELFNLRICNPFHSIEMFNFLSKMPENWGKNLDLNSTKFPLKHMLKHKLNYPYEIQDGPHSYLYDVDQNFNHSREILLNSAATNYLKEKITKNKLLNNLDNKIINTDYIFKLVDKFINDKDLSTSELLDFSKIVSNSIIEIY